MASIVVLGNVNADRVVRLALPFTRGGDIGGVEEPVRLGGAAANAASALAVAGNHVRLVGFVGSDAVGDTLLALLRQFAWDVGGVGRHDGVTPQCLILVEPSGERTIVSLARSITAEPWPRLAFDGVDAVYVATRQLPPIAWFADAHAKGVPVTLQYRPGQDLPLPVEVLIASETAFGDADPWSAVTAASRVRCRWLVVTRGAAGAMATDGVRRLEVPAIAARVVDTTGAGDAFAGAVVHGTARGWPIEACLDLAARWGARAVQHHGSTAPPELVDEVS